MSLWRYQDRLPTEMRVSLGEGNTPLVKADWLSKIVSADVWLKLEGSNPTGSFKDRGMTVAVSKAVADGYQSIICASTGNTAASAAAYAASAGLDCLVILPEGKVSLGKIMQSLICQAKVIAIRGDFDQALKQVVSLAEVYPVSLVNSLNDYRLEGQKTAAFEIIDQLGEIDNLCIPVGNGGNISAYWRGFLEVAQRPRMWGFQAEGAAPLVTGDVCLNPETIATAIRIGAPVRGVDALKAAEESQGAIRAVSDEEILVAYRQLAAHGLFCEPASAASVAGLIKYGVEGKTVCVLTGHGLKDPLTAALSISEIEVVDLEEVEKRFFDK